MDAIFTSEYLGWDIVIHSICREQRYTGTAHAALTVQSESGDLWVDARTQVVTLGNRHFASSRGCSEALLADVRELIDALKK
ncbi:hypothetical protein GJ697_22900 [Pseudoduganella sp. FT25W]|uniref:Uncharacterized protein n=1 Tax=Duganella alba TaxID=2666081 RepID=A0A6L5QLL6_9BURK|nr:hypothetical protein [Duganella alba]MRX10686.1 hypothetical protein [Duganella alba]MRX18672.1 hypothetical protein [Duganella alba]